MVKSHAEISEYHGQPVFNLISEKRTDTLIGQLDHKIIWVSVIHPKYTDVSVMNDYIQPEVCVNHMDRDTGYSEMWEIIQSLHDYVDISSTWMDYQYKLNTYR